SVNMRDLKMRTELIHQLHKIAPEHIEVVKLNDYSVHIFFEVQKLWQNTKFKLLDIHLNENGVLLEIFSGYQLKNIADRNKGLVFFVRDSLRKKTSTLSIKESRKIKVGPNRTLENRKRVSKSTKVERQR